jgi:hypothetical protein
MNFTQNFKSLEDLMIIQFFVDANFPQMILHKFHYMFHHQINVLQQHKANKMRMVLNVAKLAVNVVTNYQGLFAVRAK